MNSKEIKNHIKQKTKVTLDTSDDITLKDIVVVYHEIYDVFNSPDRRQELMRALVVNGGLTKASKHLSCIANYGMNSDEWENQYWDDPLFQFVVKAVGEEHADTLLEKECTKFYYESYDTEEN